MKRPFLIISTTVCIAVVIGIGLWVAVRRQTEPPRTYTAQAGSIVQEVSFTGNLQSAKTATLGFETGGIVKSMDVKIGDYVSEGQVLAAVDARTSQLEIAKVRADRLGAAEQARLAWEKAKKDQQNTSTSNAATLERYRQTVRDTKASLDHQKTVWQQVVRESGDEASTAKTSYATVLTAENAYRSAQEILTEAEKAAKKSEDAAKGAADITQAQYLSILQVSPQEKGLSAMGALEEMARVKLSKGTILAPFSGVVTSKKVDVGEMALPGAAVLTVETSSELEVTAQVPEMEATKLVVGQKASVTFDAFSASDIASAEVSYIAPTAVSIEGVPVFEVRLRLVDQDARLKPGLSTNVVVETGRRDDVVAIPRRSVIFREDHQVVRLLDEANNITEQSVKTGLVGSEGLVEVVEGVVAGDVIVIEQIKAEES